MTIVLGAGASKCAGGPLICDFRAAAEAILEAGSFSNERARGMFEHALKWWVERHPSQDVESLFVMLENEASLESKDLGIPQSRWPPEYQRSSVFSRFRGLRENFRYLITKTLIASIAGPHAAHELFVEKMVRPRRAGLLTLNWDLTLESALARARIDFELGHARGFPERPLLAKLHGSLDWYLCETCQAVNQISVSDSLHWWESHEKPRHCPCGGEIWPLMVPPVASKLTSASNAPILVNVWRSAQWQLFNCEELVFVGYSLPATDMEIRMFLREAFSYGIAKPKITIVDPHPVELLPKYYGIFEGIVPLKNFTLHQGTFEDWVQDL